MNTIPYAGELTPLQAHEWWKDGRAVIVDVRTQEERHFVGQVPGTLAIEWGKGMMMQPNEQFVSTLENKVPDKYSPVLFLCRSGARSHQAAMAAAQHGYTKAYNVLQGFEGDKNSAGQRRRLNGWVAAGLPWIQN
jgi:rhodanese-related sulfurtransferase